MKLGFLSALSANPTIPGVILKFQDPTNESGAIKYYWAPGIPSSLIDPYNGQLLTGYTQISASQIPDISWIPGDSAFLQFYGQSGANDGSAWYAQVTGQYSGYGSYPSPWIGAMLMAIQGADLSKTVYGPWPDIVQHYLAAVPGSSGIDWRIPAAYAYPASSAPSWLNPYQAITDILNRQGGFSQYLPTADQMAQGEQLKQQALNYQSSSTVMDMIKTGLPIALAMIGLNYYLTGAIPYVSAPTPTMPSLAVSPDISTVAASVPTATPTTIGTSAISDTTTSLGTSAADAAGGMVPITSAPETGLAYSSTTGVGAELTATSAMESAVGLPTGLTDATSLPSAPSAPSTGEAGTAGTTAESAGGTTSNVVSSASGLLKTGAGLLATGLPFLQKLFGAAPTGTLTPDQIAAMQAAQQRKKMLLLIGAAAVGLFIVTKPKKGEKQPETGFVR